MVTDLIPSGEFLATGLQKASAMKKKHRVIADKHTATFEPHVIAKWETMRRKWDENHANPDPYKEPDSGKYSNIYCVHYLMLTKYSC